MDNGTTVQDANNSPVDAGGGSVPELQTQMQNQLGVPVVTKCMILQIVQTDKAHNLHKTQVVVAPKYCSNEPYPTLNYTPARALK